MAKKRDNYTSLETRAVTKALLFLGDIAPEIDMTTDVPFNTTVVMSTAIEPTGFGLEGIESLNAALIAGRISSDQLLGAYRTMAADIVAPVATTTLSYTVPIMSGGSQAPLHPTKFGYKKSMIEAGAEFIFVNAYMGTNGDLIVRATPVDSQPYKAAEYVAGDLDRVFPNFSYDLVKKIEHANRQIAGRIHRNDSTRTVFECVLDHFMAEEQEFLEKLKAEEEARKREAEREMEDLPTWGMF